jgi:hypothetical protein
LTREVEQTQMPQFLNRLFSEAPRASLLYVGMVIRYEALLSHRCRELQGERSFFARTPSAVRNQAADARARTVHQLALKSQCACRPGDPRPGR